MKEFPSKIFFFCAQPSPTGGETSILPSHIIPEKMEDLVPEFVSKLQRLGYVFQKQMPKQNETNTIVCKTWRWLFQTDDEVEAQKRYENN